MSDLIAKLENVVSAIASGDLDILNDFLVQGGDPNTSVRGRPLLLWAAQESNDEAVRMLLESQAQPSLVDQHGFTPLYQAAGEGDSKTLRLLVSYGADVNQCTSQGTALSVACAYELIDVVHLLVSLGADPMIADSDGESAMSIATKYQSRELLEALQSKRLS